MSGQIVSLHNRKMNAVKTAENGVVNAKTIFHFRHSEDVVTAEYEGGKVRKGFLIGKIEGQKLIFQYTQIHTDDKLDGGRSICEIVRLPDGRVQLVEHFKWSAGEGTNIIEELV